MDGESWREMGDGWVLSGRCQKKEAASQSGETCRSDQLNPDIHHHKRRSCYGQHNPIYEVL